MNRESSLERLKKQLLSTNTTASPEATPVVPVRSLSSIPSTYYQFDRFPEYKEFTTMEWFYQKQGYTRNQFLTHWGSSDATVTLEGREVINFSRITTWHWLRIHVSRRPAQEAIGIYGTSTGSGTLHHRLKLPFTQQFEREICEVLGTEDAVLSVGGLQHNAFTIAYLVAIKTLSCMTN